MWCVHSHIITTHPHDALYMFRGGLGKLMYIPPVSNGDYPSAPLSDLIIVHTDSQAGGSWRRSQSIKP